MQLSLLDAIENKQAGIKQAVAHADEVHADWSDKTYQLFKEFIATQDEAFLIENFRAWVAFNYKDYNWPPSARAMGFLPLKAAREKIITKVGYGKTSNPLAHNTPATLWRRI